MANGLQEHGWVGGGLPVRAHPGISNEYQLVFGERRWRAAKLAGLVAIPCEVSSFSDDDMVEIGLIENIQREDLSRYEEGMAYQSLLDLRNEDGRTKYSIRSLARRLGKDKSYVEDRLQYARAPEEVQQLIEEKPDIAPRMVRELAHVEDEKVRGALIEAVRQDQVDIEDVRQIRKQLAIQPQPMTEDSAGSREQEEIPDPIAVLVPGVEGASAPAVAKYVPNVEAQRWVLQGQYQTDGRKISRLLKKWAEKPDLADESLGYDVRRYIRDWEDIIAQIKETWKRREE